MTKVYLDHGKRELEVEVEARAFTSKKLYSFSSSNGDLQPAANKHHTSGHFSLFIEHLLIMFSYNDEIITEALKLGVKKFIGKFGNAEKVFNDLSNEIKKCNKKD